MESNRLLIVAASCALPLSILACGGSDDAPGTIVPEGTHHGYVVSKATVIPASGHQPPELGLDVGSSTSATPDGKLDNQLGQAFVTLASLMFDVQGAIDTAINNAAISLLIDFQTKDFTASSAAGLEVKFGANPTPAACSSPADTTCGNQLKGDAMFQIAANSPNDAPLAGKIVNGTFNSDAGDLTLQIALGAGTSPITMTLHHARAKASTISDTGIMTANLGGVLTVDDLTTQVGPAIKGQVDALLAANCTALDRPDLGCGCTGTGATLVIMMVDGDTGTPKDCMISVEELLGNPIVKQSLKADSCSKDTCATADSLSVGIKIEAVKATFPM
jgi:hypothetical protein